MPLGSYLFRVDLTGKNGPERIYADDITVNTSYRTYKIEHDINYEKPKFVGGVMNDDNVNYYNYFYLYKAHWVKEYKCIYSYIGDSDKESYNIERYRIKLSHKTMLEEINNPQFIALHNRLLDAVINDSVEDVYEIVCIIEHFIDDVNAKINDYVEQLLSGDIICATKRTQSELEK